MRILLDENMPRKLLAALAEEGHEVDSVKSLQLAGIDNGTLYQMAASSYDLCFTRDAEFSRYTKDNYDPFGQHSIVPTQTEISLKNEALTCYESQLNIERVRLDHFEMVRGKPEYLNDTHPYR